MRKNCSERMYKTVNQGHLWGEGQGCQKSGGGDSFSL